MAVSYAPAPTSSLSPATRRRRSATRLPLLLLVAGCGGTPTNGTDVDTPVATTIEITTASVDMNFLGQNVPLTARVLDQNGNVMAGAEVIWSSDDVAVVTVSDAGLATAVANGSATITAASGSLNATVPVTVEQLATVVVVLAGNAQEAVAGTPLADPVVAQARDRGGSPVEGVAMTFTPDPDNGSVSVTTATTGTNGDAQTVWTLGAPFGPQQLVAATEQANTTVTATARSDVPTPDIAVISSLGITRGDPTSLESFTASATVRNEGDLTTGTVNTLRLLASGVEIGSAPIPVLAPNEEALIQIDAGPLDAGSYTMRVDADPDDALLELNEVNNSAERALAVVSQTVIQDGANVPVAGTTGNELLFRLDLGGAPQNLTVELTGGTGDADLFVDGTGRPSARANYAGCISAGPTTVERCQIALASGIYHIQVHAFSTYSGTTLRISTGGALLPYQIEVVFIDNGTAAQDQAFLDAADRWDDIIAADVPDHDFSTNPLPLNQCIDGQPEISDVIDDVQIYVSIEAIDGAGGTLARAGPCATRGLTNLPIVGTAQFDRADLDNLETNGGLETVILHEMGHVLGIGTIWGGQARNLLRNPSVPDNPGVDTHFIGPNAIEAFDAAGGATYLNAKVPVENQANEGSSDGHWRESVLNLELMTPFLDTGQPNPLSAISIQSVKDLGYSVDVSQADVFMFVLPAQAGAVVDPDNRQVIDLRGDVRTGPVFSIGPKGEIVRIRR